MSKQLELAKFVAENNRIWIQLKIINAVEDFLATGKPVYSESAYNQIFDDGMFEIFFSAPIGSASYLSYIEENGDAEDECNFINEVWIDVLTNAKVDRFIPIINKLKDIKENGL